MLSVNRLHSTELKSVVCKDKRLNRQERDRALMFTVDLRICSLIKALVQHNKYSRPLLLSSFHKLHVSLFSLHLCKAADDFAFHCFLISSFVSPLLFYVDVQAVFSGRPWQLFTPPEISCAPVSKWQTRAVFILTSHQLLLRLYQGEP